MPKNAQQFRFFTRSAFMNGKCLFYTESVRKKTTNPQKIFTKWENQHLIVSLVEIDDVT